jgi:hypothetical protein
MGSSIEQLTTGEVILAGVDIYQGAEAIRVLARDASEKIMLATGLTKPTDATAGYAKSCLFIKTNAATGTAGLYENIGTTLSCNFNLVGAVTAGEITLATGSILVGAAGVGSALDAKTTGRLLIGNGTTLASIAMQGDATIIADGTLTIANDAVTEAKLANNLLTKSLRCQPVLAVDDRFVSTVAMKATPYTVANARPSDSLYRNITVTHATVDTTDTLTGGVLVTGTNCLNEVITETIIISADGVATGLNAFKTVTAVQTSGWVQGGATADNIKVGFGNKIGMEFACSSASAFTLCTLGTAVIQNPTVTLSSNVHLTTVDASSGTYDGSKYMSVIFVGV